MFAAGWSLGANILLCYLGEEGQQNRAPLDGAVSLCNPFDLVSPQITEWLADFQHPARPLCFL